MTYRAVLFAICTFFLGISLASSERNVCENVTCGYLTRCGNTTDGKGDPILTCVCENESGRQRKELVKGNNGSLLNCRERCSPENRACKENTTCREISGNLSICLCDQWFGRSSTGHCHDVDECVGNPSICGQHIVCTNTVGNYTCDCEEGFTLGEDYRQGCVAVPKPNDPQVLRAAAGVASTVLLIGIVIVISIVVWKKKANRSSPELEEQSNEISDPRHRSTDNTVLPPLEYDVASTSGAVDIVPTVGRGSSGYISMENLSREQYENVTSRGRSHDLARNTEDGSKASYVSMKAMVQDSSSLGNESYENVRKVKIPNPEQNCDEQLTANEDIANGMAENSLEGSFYANDVSGGLYINTGNPIGRNKRQPLKHWGNRNRE